MRIELNDKYIIVTDKHNWILQERSYTDPTHRLATSDKPQEKLKDIGYYGKLDILIKSLLNRELRQGECKDLKELLEHLITIENMVKIAVGNIKREAE